ncbi:hypothetical protein [Pseudochrobactrum saccharolyticum]|uniref:hypothetical protein n=1 Tax=Pseudochrobactrum saccharolyticum TaxID=354352 RepID=UPI002746D087|nr:hypothetical protein [Pseudochrobactrum saccharolyticum]MDP8251486.1 hypothetical protein [Pseudochrobactrum saccharolyticum]
MSEDRLFTRQIIDDMREEPSRLAFIPSDTFHRLTHGLAEDMAKLMPEVDGSTAHKVAEVLSRYGIFPNSISTQIIDDIHDDLKRQFMSSMKGN